MTLAPRAAPALFAVLPLALALGGCGDKGDSGLVCDTSAAASVQVVVTDATANVLPDATVTYAVGGGASQPCEALGSQYICGWEVSGVLTVTAAVSGFEAQSQDVTVPAGTCHVETQNVTLRLNAE